MTTDDAGPSDPSRCSIVARDPKAARARWVDGPMDKALECFWCCVGNGLLAGICSLLAIYCDPPIVASVCGQLFAIVAAGYLLAGVTYVSESRNANRILFGDKVKQ